MTAKEIQTKLRRQFHSGEDWIVFEELRTGIGYDVVHFLAHEHSTAELLPTSPYIVAGDGGRGLRHSVVHKGGKLYHDPHPDGEGLVSKPDWYWIIFQIDW